MHVFHHNMKYQTQVYKQANTRDQRKQNIDFHAFVFVALVFIYIGYFGQIKYNGPITYFL